MYEKNLKFVIHSDLSTLLIVFLNKAAISSLTFFFKFRKEIIIIAVIDFCVESFVFFVFIFVN